MIYKEMKVFMELYSRSLDKSNKLMSYSRYDVSLMKHLLYNFLKQINAEILDSDYEFMTQSVMSTITDNAIKNDSRVLELTAYSSYQCRESTAYKPCPNRMNYSNNDRMHMFEINESKIVEANFYISGIGSVNVVNLQNKKHIKNLKCKLGWIKSTNKDKVGF
jgi:hypothetical protein